jgi:hypothetical protein
MSLQRINLDLPAELLQEIDAVVGPHGRSAFLVDAVKTELRRRRLLRFLHSDEPAWQEESHPELQDGTSAWVKQLRQESDTRARQSKADSE